MKNDIAGKTEVTLDGKTYTLRFDWDVIAEMTQEFPGGYNLMDPRHLSKILVYGLRHMNPDLDEQKIMGMSPALIPTMEAVGAAINCAYFGNPDGPKEAEEPKENPPKKAAGKAA